ncbi:MAG: primosomal protein N', partial [Acidobacteriota bacterium]
RIVLGVRSAVFMPVRNPGIILVDEEHDSSYKQDDHLRYHARDIAVMRARMLGIPVVLGSATPSLQSLHHSRSGRYREIRLPTRILDRPLPEVEAVDMRRESAKSRIISHRLGEALKETFRSGEQALLFLNRRGFATFLLCVACGHVPQCAACSVSLTYHQKAAVLRCHYCGWETSVPPTCPACGHKPLIRHGFGTERIEEEVRLLLPEAGIVRIDRDTASQPHQMAERFDAIRSHKADVAIGTQMVAKGHDFPNITLVGVINGDTALQIADFRAGESTVQLLMQVSGRAGRGEKPGKVILQTYNPFHYTIASVLDRDYEGFCDKELESRRLLQYPPFARLLKFLVTAPEEETAKSASEALAEVCRETAQSLKAKNRHVAVLGPSPAPLFKLKNRYRRHIFIKTWTNQDMREFTLMVLQRSRSSAALRRAQVSIDRDPMMSI